MRIDGARVIVTGASGTLGGLLATELHRRGARLGLMGRDQERLAATAARLGDSPAVGFEAMDVEAGQEAVGVLAERLGGLDAIVLAHGVAAFGAAVDEDDAVNEHLHLVNALSPMALARAAVAAFGDGGGTVAAISAVLVDYPTTGMAAYSASKASFSAWLSVLRAEQRRRGVTVLDVRAPHMETGLTTRPIAGNAPSALPKPYDTAEFAAAVAEAIEKGAGVLSYDPRARSLSSRAH
ncbi:SDR family NAD(P)-dependent oxidoreductase [Nocardiopsis ansamitocini]|uniref:Short-chain dehydrogenase n=1 Tax=Nocardiopsis ansamitocini TaxID=1670832 RepID=A0A9W6P2K5_9ACTN|nr:SDR family oxidoreductase [Nocardiopsis ansamitocini]GLU45952.1 short-chain dehydrogenase [Nocardiopsis ansamitocini]